MSGQTNERAFESYVETILSDRSRLAGRHERRVGCRTRALSRAGLRLPRSDAAEALGRDASARTAQGWRACSSARWSRSSTSRARCTCCGTASSSTARRFRLAYFKPAHGLNEEVLALYAQEPSDRHATGALSPGQARHGRSAVRGERVAGCDLRAEEPGHRPELAPCRAPIPEGPRPARAALRLQEAARWCISPPIRTRCT